MNKRNESILCLKIILLTTAFCAFSDLSFSFFKEAKTAQYEQRQAQFQKTDSMKEIAKKEFERIGTVEQSYVYTYKDFDSGITRDSVHIVSNLTLVLVSNNKSFALDREIPLIKPGSSVWKGSKDGIDYLCVGDKNVVCSTLNPKDLMFAY
ncbi:hypothetical protein F0M16_18025 [Vibrio cholerae]|uniref:Uncharacterized protein n=1 Tax=Vibrio cholerae TaxID=666 RepID=A0A5Q6PEH3_VIBCL|nr:hypothetical protein [Vibrio cholerae]KAA1253292.1 hypothetical protein F0M16_18025 [Vibrio cholerae]